MILKEDLKKKELELKRLHEEFRQLRWKYEKETELPRALKLVGKVQHRQLNEDITRQHNCCLDTYRRITHANTAGFFYYQQVWIDSDGSIKLNRNGVSPLCQLFEPEWELVQNSNWKSILKDASDLLDKLGEKVKPCSK